MMKLASTTLTLLSMALVLLPMSRSVAALSEADIKAKEAKITLGAASDENALLQEKMLLQQSSIQALTDSLVNANAQAEAYKREAADLRMKIETLGISDDKGETKLQQKLLAAVGDLRLAQRSQQETREQLIKLSETVLTLLKSSDNINPQLRLTVEGELRATNEMLGAVPANVVAGRAEPTTIMDGMVVDVKNDLSLVVANIGNKQNVKVGMPFKVLRNDEIIGEVKVVDVRDRFCGAIIYNLASEKQAIRVGDRLKVEARQ